MIKQKLLEKVLPIDNLIDRNCRKVQLKMILAEFQTCFLPKIRKTRSFLLDVIPKKFEIFRTCWEMQRIGTQNESQLFFSSAPLHRLHLIHDKLPSVSYSQEKNSLEAWWFTFLATEIWLAKHSQKCTNVWFFWRSNSFLFIITGWALCVNKFIERCYE